MGREARMLKKAAQKGLQPKKPRPDTNEIDDIFSKPKATATKNRANKSGAKGLPLKGPAKSKPAKSIASSKPKKSSSVSSTATKPVEVVVANQVIQQDANVAKELQRKHGEPTKKRKANDSDDDGFFDSRGTKSKQYTEDGLPVFTVQDLGIGEGGDTPDCPFDCQCCF